MLLKSDIIIGNITIYCNKTRVNMLQKKGYQRYGNPFNYTKTNLTSQIY